MYNGDEVVVSVRERWIKARLCNMTLVNTHSDKVVKEVNKKNAE